jgi:hypothetical protein
VLKGGKRVHRAGVTASAVPRAEESTTEDTEDTERIFWQKYIDAAPTSGVLLAGGDAMAREEKSAPTTEPPGGSEEAHPRWPEGCSDLSASKAKRRPTADWAVGSKRKGLPLRGAPLVLSFAMRLSLGADG